MSGNERSEKSLAACPFQGTSILQFYDIQAVIGRGGFGTVYKATRNLDSLPVAIKVFRKYDESKRNNNSFLRQEYETLRVLRCPNIVQLLDYQENSHSIYLFLEYCHGGDLVKYMNGFRISKNRLFDESEASCIIKGVLKALYHLHYQQKIIHRDIKPGNILIRRADTGPLTEDDVCIGDFGLSISLSNSHTSKAVENCGTDSYKAPEQLAHEAYGDVRTLIIEGVDIFAVAITTYILLTGEHPFITNRRLLESKLKAADWTVLQTSGLPW